MKKSILIAMMFLMGWSVLAQNNCITGRLSDESGQPVALANVRLKSIDTDKLITSTTTDTLGAFSIACGSESYTLVATCVGYERLNVRCEAGDLGTLTMGIKQLQTVTVTASRTSEEPDRYVVLPKKEEAEAAGRTLVLLDMLKLPGLRVDVALEQITVDGGTAILQINGKEVPLARLANLKAEQVKRVEYSNNPGIRYLDCGAAGIINIILKEREDGGNIVAQGQTAFNTGFVNGYLQGSYHKGKSEFALEYTLGYRNYDDVPYELEDSYLDPSRTVTRSQRTNMPFWFLSHNLNAAYTYQHDDSTMFVASLQDNYFTKTLTAAGTMTETDCGTTTVQTMQQESHSKDNMPTIDLFYTQKMPKGQKVELNLVGTYSVNHYDNTLTYTSGSYAKVNEGCGYALSGEGVYSKKFEKVELRTGLQYQNNFSENEYMLYGVITSMTKDNAYLYAELQGTIGGKVGYSLGSGAKLLNVTDGQSSKRYLRNLSTALLQWRISDQWSLNATAQYTPILPTLSWLSPVFQQTDDVEGQIGNPDLKPIEQLSARLKLRYTHPKGRFANIGGGGIRQFHPIVAVYAFDPATNLFIAHLVNADYWNACYAGVESGVQGLWQHVNFSVEGDCIQYQSVGPGYSHTKSHVTAAANAQFYWKSLVAGANFTLLTNWFLNGEEYGPNEMAQTIYVQYRWNSLQAMLAWHCPFNPKGYRYEAIGLSEVHPYHHVHYTANNGNMVVLGLTWQMNFGKQYRKSEKTLQNGGYDNGMVK